jgi:triphosphatase
MAAAVARPIEIEWQFVPRDAAAFARWLARARFDDAWSVVPAATQVLADAYFDSDDRRIARAGFAFRVRRVGSSVEATLKALRRAEDGVARRREITSRLTGATIAAVRASRGAVGTRLRRTVGSAPLRRLFALRTRRRTFTLRLHGRVVAELALDRTAVIVRGRVARRIERVEVEVKAGPPARVAVFAATLRRGGHLTLARRSKFDEGLRAARCAR